MLQATAESYVISTVALSPLAPDPAHEPDQLSAGWMLALGARLVREVGQLRAGAREAGKPLATFAIDSEIRFASAAERAAFARGVWARLWSAWSPDTTTTRRRAGVAIGWWWLCIRA